MTIYFKQKHESFYSTSFLRLLTFCIRNKKFWKEEQKKSYKMRVHGCDKRKCNKWRETKKRYEIKS